MYTRQAFDRLRAEGRSVQRHDGRVVAAVSVGLGVAQIFLIRWLEAQVPRTRALTIEGAAFLVYLAVVAWLIWRMQRRLRATRITCPQCGVRLEGMSERVAAATGHCDSCGGQVLDGVPPEP